MKPELPTILAIVGMIAMAASALAADEDAKPNLAQQANNPIANMISVPFQYNGNFAAFTGGLRFGAIAKDDKPKLLLAAEGTGDTLGLITWVVFGAAVVGQAIGSFSWQVLVYAILCLTLVRMLPVFLTLAGMNLRTDEKLFMVWFGPRGLASIVFAVIVLNEHLPGGNTIAMAVVCTIVLSVVAHGLSANPLVAALATRIKCS